MGNNTTYVTWQPNYYHDGCKQRFKFKHGNYRTNKMEWNKIFSFSRHQKPSSETNNTIVHPINTI